MKTQENLMAAFAGESQANRKYLAFAKVAEKEGKTGLAKLFRVAAEAETIHALRHLENAGQVRNSAENLQEAIAGETYEFTDMYPSFIAEAEEEGAGAAKAGFVGASEVEKVHAKLFSDAAENEGEIAEREYFICPVCGFPSLDEAPEKCPVCATPKERFYRFE